MAKHVSPEALAAAKSRLEGVPFRVVLEAATKGPYTRTAFPAQDVAGDSGMLIEDGMFVSVEFGVNEAGQLTSYATLVNATGDPQGPTVEGGTCPPWCTPPAGGG